jgi:CPA1 family monovalent cation:H+ antiporter
MREVAEFFVGLSMAVAVLALVARKLTIPYPILFLVGKLLLGLIPKQPTDVRVCSKLLLRS